MKINTLLLSMPIITALAFTFFFNGYERDRVSKGEDIFPIKIPVHLAPEEPVDVAQFARVVTWDPRRNDGTHAKRNEEFPKKDLFLAKNILPDSLGHYLLPVTSAGEGCIGLQWLNQRTIKELGIEFIDVNQIPTVSKVQIQGWFGESVWQGKWQTLAGDFTVNGNKVVFNVSDKAGQKEKLQTQKIRWIFPASSRHTVIRTLSALTRSSWDTTTLVIEVENATKNAQGEITVYNGNLPQAGILSTYKRWSLSRPLHLSIRYSLASMTKSDPTILQFHLPSGSFSVAIDDIMESKCVYVPEHGLFIARESVKTSLTKYKKEIAGRKTILQEVNEMPDQTFAQAMDKTHHEIQKNGPVMLSLASDNVKFLVQREGVIQFETSDNPTDGAFVTEGEMRPKFGITPNRSLERHLEDGWMPIPVISIKKDSIIYTQRTFVAPFDNLDSQSTRLNRQSVCVVEFTIRNTTIHPVDASLSLAFSENVKEKKTALLNQAHQGYWVKKKEGTTIALIDTTGGGILQSNIDNGMVTFQGKLSAEATAHYTVYFPGVNLGAGDIDSFLNPSVLLQRVIDYWKLVMKPAMHIEIPDTLLQNAILSSQVRCLIDSRNEANGTRTAPWVSAMHYGALGSEGNSVIRGMDFFGHTEFARRSLDYFAYRYNAAGFLTTGYTTFATGWNLWMIGEHYQLNRDLEWFKGVAPIVSRAGQWISKQIKKTKRLNSSGQIVPEYGLMPPGVTADWNAFAYRFSLDAYYYAGLQEAGISLAQIDYPEGKDLLESATELRCNLLRNYHWTQSLAPVLPLRNGTWVTPYPAQLFSPGKVNDFFPDQDAGRSWATDVELGAHQMVPTKVLNVNSLEVTQMLNHMEDVQFLQDGWFDYPAEINQKDWFNLGGFSKVQPYYTRNIEIYALRDDVKPFVRSYFNTLAAMLNPEILTIWEHFHNTGAPDKTHETGYFLYQTRTMLVMEHGNELWLAPFITNNWLKDKMTIAVENAPTYFGKVSYRIESHVAQQYIEAIVKPPTRQKAEILVIRLPHPEGKLIKSVTINGKDTKQFDPVKGTVSFNPEPGIISKVIVKY